MDINTIHAFTGHSDRKQLVNFVSKLNPKPKKLIAVHGEQSRSLDFASSVHKMFRMETTVPKNLEAIRLR